MVKMQISQQSQSSFFEPARPMTSPTHLSQTHLRGEPLALPIIVSGAPLPWYTGYTKYILEDRDDQLSPTWKQALTKPSIEAYKSKVGGYMPYAGPFSRQLGALRWHFPQIVEHYQSSSESKGELDISPIGPVLRIVRTVNIKHFLRNTKCISSRIQIVFHNTTLTYMKRRARQSVPFYKNCPHCQNLQRFPRRRLSTSGSGAPIKMTLEEE